ncbi:DUF4113 domain-containing protein [Psychromonas ingrahamii]
MRRQFLTPQYTTKWHEIAEIYLISMGKYKKLPSR